MTMQIAVAPPHLANALVSSNKSGDVWPMFRGSLNHTGMASTVPSCSAEPFWNNPTLSIVTSSPAIVGGRVYVGSGDAKVYCLNATTGALIWSNTTGSSVYSSPAVASGYVYVGSEDHKIYCFNATTGAKVWSNTTGNGVYSSPAVAGGFVYVGSYDDKIYCLNDTTGSIVWSNKTGGFVDSSPAIANGRLYAGSYDDKIYCLNATTGALLWDNVTGDSVGSSPAVAGGRVYVGSDDNRIYCLNATTGVILWKNVTEGSIQSSPAVVGGFVYIGSYDDDIYCLNASTGEFVWSFATGKSVYSSPAIVDGFVFVGSDDNKTYCLNATTGELVWSYTTGSGVLSSPAIAGGRVYIGSDDHKVYCFPMILGTSPSVPRMFYVFNSSQQVILSWQAPSNNGGLAITSYRIYQGSTPGGETLLATAGNVTSYPSTGLINGQVYYFKVAGVNIAGVGTNTTEIVAIPIGPPTAPQLLMTTGGIGKIVLMWLSPASNGGSAITNYTIYKGMTSGGETLLTTLGFVLIYTDSNVTNGATYYYKVQARNSLGLGANSTEESAMPLMLPTISRPANITYMVGQIGNEISWTITGTSTSTRSYTIYRNGTSVHADSWTSGTPITWIVDGLSIGTYNYTIVATDGPGGSIQDTVIVTVISAPSQPNPLLNPVTLASIGLVAGGIIIVAVAVGVSKKRARKRKSSDSPQLAQNFGAKK